MSVDTEAPVVDAAGAETGESRPSARMSRSTAIELFGIPVLVIVGFLLYVWWRQTATLDYVERSSLGWTAVRLQIWQHVKLTIVASLIVVAIAVPLGTLLTRPGVTFLAPVVVGVANAGQAAPSIGLIVLLFMWLSSWSGSGWLSPR